MRTKRQQLNREMEVIETEYQEYAWVPSDLDLLLGRKGLKRIIIEPEDPTLAIIVYYAWEFDCPVCGEYGHIEAECPELDSEVAEELGFMAKPPKFKVGDLVTMHNAEGVYAISNVRPSDAPHRSHKYSVNGDVREYYESVFERA